MITFDKLFSISDLHIGGPAGKRAFREATALAALIRYVASDQPKLKVALLLNGDIFDFLAEDDAKEFAFDADRIIRSLATDPELSPIFAALSAFVATPQRTLILQIGNHDIELALPDVQRAFLDCIGAPITATGAPVYFETNGRGWACNVGDRTVLAVHGNVSDPWNAVDQPGLRAAASAQSFGRSPLPEPETNAGTRLVVGVMNEIKRRFPVVDLLKPEGAPLMAVLNALDAPTSALGLLRAAGRIRVQRGTMDDLLSADDPEFEVPEGPQREVLSFLESMEPPAGAPTDRLQRAEKNLHARRSPRDLVEDEDAQLGSLTEYGKTGLYRISAWFKDRQAVEPQLGPLRLALSRWLRDDETFDRRRGSSIDKRIIAAARPGIDVIIAGHTHLPREFRDDDALYLNTGTWMRLLKLNGSKYLRSDAEFQLFFDAIKSGKLEEIDKLGLDPRWRPVAVVDESSARLLSASPLGIPVEFPVEGGS